MSAAPKENHAAVVEHYARLAPNYDARWDRYSRATLDAVLQQIDPRRTDALLDVACGTGRFAEMIRSLKPSLSITGVDLSPAMIEVARKRLPPAPINPGVSWLVGPAESLPVKNDAFDVVTCANAFHLVADPRKALAEFHRALKPGGSLILIDWCREYPTILAVLIGSRLFGRQYRRIQTRSALTRLVESAGFHVRHIQKFKATWFWGMMCLRAEKMS